jgi:aryl-alcohol dehydrogenase-like predicted oxidoreductase
MRVWSAMKAMILPGTDLTVSSLCLGTADSGTRNTEAEAHALMDRFAAAGGRYLDTARVYSDWVPGETGRSERILGDWLSMRSDRAKLVVSTKGGHPPLGDLTHPRLAPGQLAEDLESSLRALRVPAVDLYFLHRDNAALPVGPLIDTLEGFSRQGLIRYYACSNWTVPRIREANAYAWNRGFRGFVANQVMWNMGSHNMKPPADRTIVRFDQEARRLHRETGMAVIAYSSQAGGFFSKLPGARPDPASSLRESPYWTEANIRLAEEAESVARRTGAPVSSIVLAYIMSQEMTAIPVIGCHSMAQLEDSLQAAEMRLDTATLAGLNTAAEPMQE